MYYPSYFPIVNVSVITAIIILDIIKICETTEVSNFVFLGKMKIPEPLIMSDCISCVTSGSKTTDITQ